MKIKSMKTLRDKGAKGWYDLSLEFPDFTKELAVSSTSSHGGQSKWANMPGGLQIVAFCLLSKCMASEETESLKEGTIDRLCLTNSQNLLSETSKTRSH